MMNDFLISSPLWSVFLFSLFPITGKLINKNKELSIFVSSLITVFGLCVSMSLLLFVWPESSKDSLDLFSSTLVFDDLVAWGTLGLQVIGMVVVIMSVSHPQVHFEKFSEIVFLKLGALLGLMVLLWSKNLLSAFVGLELSSMAFYLLIALGKVGKDALKASFTYFILGSAAAAILLYGMAMVFGAVGHFDWTYLLSHHPDLIANSRLLVLGFVLILTGFLFKISVFPFQFWMPDVYQSSFTPLLVLMTTGLKVSVFILLFKWTQYLFVRVDMSFLLAVLQWLAVLSVLFGNIIALLQSDVKRMLLFSSIAHTGYLLMILITAQMGAVMASSALLYYIMIYVIMVLGIFICLRPFEKINQYKIPMQKLTSYASQNPLHAFLITLFLFCLAGFPPTGGFIAKLFVFQVLIEQGLWWMSLWFILGSGIGLFYYLRPVVLMYMQKGKSAAVVPALLSPILKSLLFILAVLVFLSGIFPGFFTVVG